MGGHYYACETCSKGEFRFHSCNHRACPQCGRLDTARWVETQLMRRVGAPYFMVTFTLPQQLRSLFFGPFAKTAYDIFFEASSMALKEKLALPKYLRAEDSGFIAILHTWNQRLHFHPHLHYIVPAAGLDKKGNVVCLKESKYLVNIDILKGAFRQFFRNALQEHECQVDPAVWNLDWGINIEGFGDGVNAIKYLGAYVCRTAIGDSRIKKVEGDYVTFEWKDRNNKDKIETDTITGIEFVKRYLRHVLPGGLRSIRYYGFCHPAAKKKRIKIAFHTGQPLDPENAEKATALEAITNPPQCPCCDKPMRLKASYSPFSKGGCRAPPRIFSTTNTG